MSTTLALLLFAVFGGICGFYLSAVGFAVTALAICALVGVTSALFQGPFSLPLLVGSFVAMQVGFFLALAGRALVAHVSRLRAPPHDSAAASELRAERDRR